MSAYKTINCSFRDKKTLLECLKNLNFTPVEYNDGQNLRGFENDIREQKAEIIVPKQQISKASNDLGFSFDTKNKEYVMICSHYDLHSGLADKIKQSYAITAIKSALKKNKFSVKEDITIDNKITISAGKII